VRIGGSTYSREPFLKQIEELREAGFDYAELDLTWLTGEPGKLADEARALSKRLPLLPAVPRAGTGRRTVTKAREIGRLLLDSRRKVLFPICLRFPSSVDAFI